MKKTILDFDKVFDSTTRIQIISALYASELTYNELKSLCNCSDGNIATHIKKLVSEGYIEFVKDFDNNKPRTTYHITDKGKSELEEYVSIIKNIINKEN